MTCIAKYDTNLSDSQSYRHEGCILLHVFAVCVNNPQSTYQAAQHSEIAIQITWLHRPGNRFVTTSSPRGWCVQSIHSRTRCYAMMYQHATWSQSRDALQLNEVTHTPAQEEETCKQLDKNKGKSQSAVSHLAMAPDNKGTMCW